MTEPAWQENEAHGTHVLTAEEVVRVIARLEKLWQDTLRQVSELQRDRLQQVLEKPTNSNSAAVNPTPYHASSFARIVGMRRGRYVRRYLGRVRNSRHDGSES
jgi:hypothetical protein